MAIDQIAFNATIMQLENNQIVELDLSNKGLNSSDAIRLANSLKINTSLRILNLQSNNIRLPYSGPQR